MKKKEYQPKPFIYEIYKNGQLLSVVLTEKDLKKEIQKIKEWGNGLVGCRPPHPPRPLYLIKGVVKETFT